MQKSLFKSGGSFIQEKWVMSIETIKHKWDVLLFKIIRDLISKTKQRKWHWSSRDQQHISEPHAFNVLSNPGLHQQTLNAVNLREPQVWDFRRTVVHTRVLTHSRNSDCFPRRDDGVPQSICLSAPQSFVSQTSAKLGLLPVALEQNHQPLLPERQEKPSPPPGPHQYHVHADWATHRATHPPWRHSDNHRKGCVRRAHQLPKEGLKGWGFLRDSNVSNSKTRIWNYEIKIANATLSAVGSSVFKAWLLFHTI